MDFRGPIIGSLKSSCVRLPIDTVVLSLLVFEKIAFLQFGDRQTNKQTDRHTNRWTRPSHEAALAVASGGLINVLDVFEHRPKLSVLRDAMFAPSSGGGRDAQHLHYSRVSRGSLVVRIFQVKYLDACKVTWLSNAKL